MDLRNPSGLYTAGAVSLNPLPYVNIALQQRARRQAREDAIDKYYQNLPNTINDKGVRDQEVPVINQIRDEMFEYGLKNKEALRNPKLDNGAAQHGLQQLFRKASTVSRLSQDAAKEDLEIGKLWLSKDNRWVVDDDEFIAANQKHNLPVTHPDFKKVDIPLILQGRPFDQTAFRKELKDFKYDEGTPTITPHPTDKLMEVVTTNPILGEDTKKSIYSFSADKYHSNRSFRKKIENDLAQTGQLPVLQDIFQKTFGKPIETDEDIAAAYTVSQLPTSSTRAKVIPNTEAVMDKKRKEGNEDWLWKNGIVYQESLNKIAANKQAGISLESGVGYPTEEIAKKYGKEQDVTMPGRGKTRQTVIFTDEADPNEIDFIRGFVKGKSLGVEPITFKGGRKGFIYHPGTKDWEGANGQMVNGERVRRSLLDDIINTKFKAEQNTKNKTRTKASENKNKAELDPTGFKKEGKYWRYKDGRLFDDAGKVINQ